MPFPPKNHESAAQQSLFGFEPDNAGFKLDDIGRPTGKPHPYKLFFAIFPENADAHRLALAAKDLRHEHQLTGNLISSDRLHVTLHSLGGFFDFVPKVIIEAAMAGAAKVDCSQFDVAFDKVQSFAPKGAFVLSPDAISNVAITRLRQHLAVALRKANLRPQASNTAHMTMLYDEEQIAIHSITPILWTATQFALIVSHEGRTHHQWAGQWPLAKSR